MKKLHKYARILIGIFFIIVSASKLNLLPNTVNRPHLFTPEGFNLIEAIASSGYMFSVIGIFLLLCGIALITNRYVALAAVVLIPITLNFALFHVFLGLREFSLREFISYVPLILNLYIIYIERGKYTTLLKP